MTDSVSDAASAEPAWIGYSFFTTDAEPVAAFTAVDSEPASGEPETEAPGAPIVDAAPEPVAKAAPAPALAPAYPAYIDPRLEALGQMQAATQGADDGIPEIAEDALMARLGSVVPVHTPPAAAIPVQTQIVVGGLVSVASIASFKRQVGRLAGINHVGVSSGPDGEFIFTVQHLDNVPLRDLIPGLPGFQARVTGEGIGTLVVAARDPEG